MAKKKFIAIAGNIGAGKTELTAFLCRKYGLTPFFEPNDQNPYLADFYKDMKTWAFRSQIFFLTHKFRLHRELEKERRHRAAGPHDLRGRGDLRQEPPPPALHRQAGLQDLLGALRDPERQVAAPRRT